MLTVHPKESASMLTRDGVRLDADIYRPDAEGEFPVLLMRQPYGRAIASTVVYAHPSWYAAHGYIVVIQDVRGRGTSQGEFKLFVNEIEDGEDAVNWAADLPGSNGKVGMYGFSYQGMTQLYAAVAKPPALKTICPAMIAYDLYSDWVYEGGAFCLQTNLGWAIQLAAETARLQGDAAAHHTLYAAAQNIPLYDPVPSLNECLRKLAPNAFYHEWLEHSQPDSYWEEISPKKYLQNVDLPMFHIGGWFDTYMRGTLHLYKDFAARSAYRQQLLVGPWAHLPWSRKVGDVDFGIEALNPVDRLQVKWFDQFLKGIDRGLSQEPPVCLFEMGSNQWRKFNDWHKEHHKLYYLSSSGLASVREDEGKLTTIYAQLCPSDVIVHDPWRPVPSLGGHAALPAGSFERSHIDRRSDVLTYTTAPLESDLHFAGDVAVEVWCDADTPHHDLCAVLSEVCTDGKVYNLTQGYLHVNDMRSPLRVVLQPTCVRIAKGNALRLSLSAACFPAYPINPGTGSPMASTRLMDSQIVTLTLHCGGDRPSQVLLPVVAPSQ
ncbi:CocE/NonD family hydrolase [Gloeocapsopsis crepidinum LEGE 06123]|uniref:CocE/NonD family hydrolase n=2 Tax=Gloeocapsopsis crepidinum TaxID=693223 RepID=A0ABR9UNI9_9CHRO|nr:CocE/NonD family hydrolase [Gloeocapsopsis crepidinum]MBE9189583.1 CocE/NonD family hydrolase [Gloeocapsopsis crepidinum LEGE 06123]